MDKISNKVGSNLLRFSLAKEQGKLRRIAEWMGYVPIVYSFNLPSGHSCPFAKECLSYADRTTGKIRDGIHTLFRCFSASMEAMSPQLRTLTWHNFDLLKHAYRDSYETLVQLLVDSMPDRMDICRVHVNGDFFNEMYMRAWFHVAGLRPDVTFYAYTKSIPYWIKNMDNIPSNFVMNGSRHGTQDHLLDEYELKTAEVVFSLEEAEEKGLEIDHDESHAIKGTDSFALLLHGTQPKGSRAAEAKKELKREGIEHEYTRKR